MALIDVAGRQIRGKIVYYGPGLGGKTTNLRFIHEHVADAAKGELQSIANERERTLFFDFMPLDLGTVDGFSIRFSLYTVSGQTDYDRPRLAVLSGADGVVFVADAQRERLEDNVRSLGELEANVARLGKPLAEFPLVLQYNKMDLPNALPADDLDRALNTAGAPRFAASAVSGEGVFDTLRAVCKLVVRKL